MPYNHHAESIFRSLIDAVTPGLFEVYSPVDGVLRGALILTGTTPVGDAIFDINTHATITGAGTSIFSDTADRLKILSGQSSGSVSGLATALLKGQKLSIDLDTAPSLFGAPVIAILSIEESAIRTELDHTTASIADGASEDFTLQLGKTYVVITIETDHPAWVVVYHSIAARTADAGRDFDTDPLPGSGVIAEVKTSIGELVITMSPQPIGSNLEEPPARNVPCRVTNKAGSSQAITVTVTSVELEL